MNVVEDPLEGASFDLEAVEVELPRACYISESRLCEVEKTEEL